MMKTCIGVLILLMPVFALAAAWDCSNNDMEITCTQEKCAMSDSFKPMSVVFNDSGSLNICAYSGCWEGQGKVFKSGDHILVSGHKLDWRGIAHDSGDFMIALEESTGIAVINGDGFAMPIICKPRNTARVPHASK